MDLTHCDVLIDGHPPLLRVPIYLTEGDGQGMSRGCLHLRRSDCAAMDCRQYRIRLSDGRSGAISIRKIISTNDARYVEALFDTLGPFPEDRDPMLVVL